MSPSFVPSPSFAPSPLSVLSPLFALLAIADPSVPPQLTRRRIHPLHMTTTSLVFNVCEVAEALDCVPLIPDAFQATHHMPWPTCMRPSPHAHALALPNPCPPSPTRQHLGCAVWMPRICSDHHLPPAHDTVLVRMPVLHTIGGKEATPWYPGRGYGMFTGTKSQHRTRTPRTPK